LEDKENYQLTNRLEALRTINSAGVLESSMCGSGRKGGGGWGPDTSNTGAKRRKNWGRGRGEQLVLEPGVVELLPSVKKVYLNLSEKTKGEPER